MRIHTELPEWMTHPYLEGNEDPPEGGTGTPPPAGDTSGNQGGNGDGADADADEDEQIPDDLAGIKSALGKTRGEKKALNKAFREADTARKAAEARLQEIDDKDKSEADKAKEAQTKATEKLAKLAEGYKKSALRTAVEKAARSAKFVDADDAYKALDLDDIDIEQDEDDPSKVTIDLKAVKKLVEDLAKRKPYLLGEGQVDGEPSGSKFNGGNGKDPKKLTEDALREKYSSLR